MGHAKGAAVSLCKYDALNKPQHAENKRNDKNGLNAACTKQLALGGAAARVGPVGRVQLNELHHFSQQDDVKLNVERHLRTSIVEQHDELLRLGAAAGAVDLRVNNHKQLAVDAVEDAHVAVRVGHQISQRLLHLTCREDGRLVRAPTQSINLERHIRSTLEDRCVSFLTVKVITCFWL